MAGKDGLTEAHERLTAAVESLVTGEDWQQLLGLAARLHRYSAKNCMLIRAQRPDATWLVGYRRWQSLGRQVRKGEKAVAILAPVVTRRRPVDGDEESEQPGLVRVLRGFTVAHIFDVSQTDGPPLPDVRPSLLEGDAPAGLWHRLAAQVAGAGFTLNRGDCRPANGVTDFVARSVTVRDDVAGAQAAKTLAHELAHVLLHDGTENAAGCRGRAEVEAESVAYLVVPPPASTAACGCGWAAASADERSAWISAFEHQGVLAAWRDRPIIVRPPADAGPRHRLRMRYEIDTARLPGVPPRTMMACADPTRDRHPCRGVIPPGVGPAELCACPCHDQPGDPDPCRHCGAEIGHLLGCPTWPARTPSTVDPDQLTLFG